MFVDVNFYGKRGLWGASLRIKAIFAPSNAQINHPVKLRALREARSIKAGKAEDGKLNKDIYRYGQMIIQTEIRIITFTNTVLLWKTRLADYLRLVSTFTTRMEFAMIIVLRILNSGRLRDSPTVSVPPSSSTVQAAPVSINNPAGVPLLLPA